MSRFGDRDYDCNCTGSAEVVELLEPTPPGSPRASFPENMGYWSERTEADKETIRIIPVKDSREFDQIKGILMAGLERGENLRSLISGYDDGVFKWTPRIVRMERLENPVMMDCFKVTERKMIFDNSRRPESNQFKGSPQTVAFHGTDMECVRKIVETGFKVLPVCFVRHWLLTPFSSPNSTVATATGSAPTPTRTGRLL